MLEASLTETREGIEASQSMGRLWETQLANIEKEVARLLCETNQLKDCNAALHNQVHRGERSRGRGGWNEGEDTWDTEELDPSSLVATVYSGSIRERQHASLFTK